MLRGLSSGETGGREMFEKKKEKKKKPTSDNPEVQKAMDARDAALEGVDDAIAEVDRLLLEYRQANGVD